MLSAVESAVSVTQRSRAALETGYPFASLLAWGASLVPLPSSVA